MEKNKKKRRKILCRLESTRPAAGKDHIPTPIFPYKTRVKRSSLFFTTPLGRNASFWMPPKNTQKHDAFSKRKKHREQNNCFAAPNARRPHKCLFLRKRARPKNGYHLFCRTKRTSGPKSAYFYVKNAPGHRRHFYIYWAGTHRRPRQKRQKAI